MAVSFAILVGCGDEPLRLDGTGPGAATKPETGPTLVATVGDSLTSGSPGWDPDPDVRHFMPEPDPRSQYQYWAKRATSGFRFRNCGIAGAKASDLAVVAQGCGAGADVLILEAGSNDAVSDVPPAKIAADLSSIARDAIERGLTVMIADVPPRNLDHPEYDDEIAEVNRRIRAIGRRLDIEVLPFHATLENPDEPGTMPVRLTADGVHPSIAGHQLLGELVAGRLEKVTG